MSVEPWPADRERPWPEQLEPGLCPSGLVFRVYGVADGEVLLEQRISLVLELDPVAIIRGETLEVAVTAAAAPIAAAAEEAADVSAAHDGDTCLVVYDGDSGARIAWADEIGFEL